MLSLSERVKAPRVHCQLGSRLVASSVSAYPLINLVVVPQHVFRRFCAICLSPFTAYRVPQLFTRVGRIWIIGLSWIAMCRY